MGNGNKSREKVAIEKWISERANLRILRDKSFSGEKVVGLKRGGQSEKSELENENEERKIREIIM